jgi:hypothetical protein
MWAAPPSLEPRAPLSTFRNPFVSPALPAARQSGLAAQAQEIEMHDHLTPVWVFGPGATADPP